MKSILFKLINNLGILAKKIIKITLMVILISFILVHLLPLILNITNTIGYFTLYRGTFIYDINTPIHGNDTTKKVLDKFNSIGYNNSVHYRGIRPVFILEANLNKTSKNYTTLGLTMPLPFYCVIWMEKRLKPELYEDVLEHEYSHCFGMMHHNENPHDLMNAFYSGKVDPKSREFYSKWIADNFYN